MQTSAASCRIKLIRTMCSDDILMPDQDRTLLCNFLWRGIEEGGGRKGRMLFTIHLCLSLACMPSLHRLRTMRSGLQRVVKVKCTLNPPLEGSIGLSELRVCWLPGCRGLPSIGSPSIALLSPPEMLMSIFWWVFHWYLFQGMPPGGLHNSRCAELPSEGEMRSSSDLKL